MIEAIISYMWSRGQGFKSHPLCCRVWLWTSCTCTCGMCLRLLASIKKG